MTNKVNEPRGNSQAVSVRTVQMIEVRLKTGSGVPNDPYRRVCQYWTTDGRFLVEVEETSRWEEEVREECGQE